MAAGVVARRRGGGGPRGARPGFALGAAEEAPAEEDAESDDEEADEIDPDFDPDDDVTMRDPEPTSRKRKAPPAPRPKRRRKTKAAPVEPVLSEYELGRRAKIKRNNKFLVSVGLLFPPCVRGVPRCCGAFTPSTRLVFIRRGRGWFLFRV